MTDQDLNKNPKLLDFNFVGDQQLSVEDMLHEAYLEGKKDFQKELKKQIDNGLQTSAVSSGLFKRELESIGVSVKDMFLKILNYTEFECLVVLSDEDYYNKEKRWLAYSISREINESIDRLSISFSLTPYSEKLEEDRITSEGFIFQYAQRTTL